MKTFPIKTDTACVLKWSWSTVFLSRGTTSSCHRVDQDKINKDNIHRFHNTDAKLAARTKMLDGEWPGNGCEYCRDIESTGGTSDRKMQLMFPEEMIPHEVEQGDLTAVDVTPRLLEVYFTNVCNMSCLYCGPWFSSKWEEENKRFGKFSKDGVTIEGAWEPAPHYDEMVAGLWKWLEEHGRKLHFYHVLGGEPFFQPELEQSIDFWDAHPNPDLVFNIVSNLKVPYKKFVALIDRFHSLIDNGKIKRLQITASLDAWGPQQEYTRWGLNLEDWQKNWDYLLQQDWITLAINHAVSSLTIKTLPDLLERMNAWQSQHEIHHSFMNVTDPNLLNPEVFGAGVFDDDFDRVLALMPEETDRQRGHKEHMLGIKMKIANHPRDLKRIHQLRVYLDEMDRRRGTSWRELFPWLDQSF
jgi:hypothetical protein